MHSLKLYRPPRRLDRTPPPPATTGFLEVDPWRLSSRTEFFRLAGTKYKPGMLKVLAIVNAHNEAYAHLKTLGPFELHSYVDDYSGDIKKSRAAFAKKHHIDVEALDAAPLLLFLLDGVVNSICRATLETREGRRWLKMLRERLQPTSPLHILRRKP